MTRSLRGGALAVAAALVMALGALAAGCGGDGTAGDRVPVVATFSIAGEWAERVGGERVQVTTLVGPDGDAHVYEPTPADAAALARARVVVENGLGFETWLDDLYASSGSAARRVVMTAGIRPLGADGHGADPHTWQSVRLARAMVAEVRDGLAAEDPAGADEYRANAEVYLAELAELEREVEAAVATLPEDRRALVTSHDTFAYLARDHGFRVLGAGLPSLTTDAADPSAADVARLAREVREAGVPAIFAENIADDRLVRQLARAAGVRVGPPLYTDALGPPGSPGATYADMIRHNVAAIVTALGGEA